MKDTADRAIAIVGVGAVLPDAPNADAFWQNLTRGKDCISETPTERWDPAVYFDPDPTVPDKTYSKIGGWVREFDWNPLAWKLPIPPKVEKAMDRTQKWAIAGARQALLDFGYPDRSPDPDRTAVILGAAMGGDLHYYTAMRILSPEYTQQLARAPSFAALPEQLRAEIQQQVTTGVAEHFPDITEDTMPGELSNVIAGRIAALFNLHGPNYTCDAACASAMAAITAAADGLVKGNYDAVITGGVDANMSPSTFTKFCKIGALSANGSYPYGHRADGFVMGEGGAFFLLKRLADAERDQDRIYAVLRGIGGASDGKGKGITAPNPVGQRFAVERGWKNSGLDPTTCTLVEGHGTSTKVGDVVECTSMGEIFGEAGAAPGTIPLGSVKSNIGHLKGAAGAAGILKAALALHHKKLPPSINFGQPNPNIDFSKSPFVVNTELRDWPEAPAGVRRAGISAFGFGGTNFHTVLEEYVPGRIASERKTTISVPAAVTSDASRSSMSTMEAKAPVRGALLVGARDTAELAKRLEQVAEDARGGRVPKPQLPTAEDLAAPLRVAIDYGDGDELKRRATMAAQAVTANQPARWKALRAQGVFRGHGPKAKAAFLYTGQGSQYMNMLSGLRRADRIVEDTLREADEVMTPLLEGRPLTDYIYVDPNNLEKLERAEIELRQTAITQPAVLATDEALTRMMAARGITPDMVMGHSLGEYGALVASGALPFAQALKAVSARGTEMTRVSVEDNGLMAAVFGPMEKVVRLLSTIDGYVEVANINSNNQCVIGGATEAVREASKQLTDMGFRVIPIPVSHAFHTRIVAPASEPLMRVLSGMDVQPPRIPLISNVTGEFYPTDGDVRSKMIELLGKQIYSPVQFVKGLNTLYAAGARIFVESGPKKALFGMAEDVLGGDDDVLCLFSNHPKVADDVAFNHAFCGLLAFGHGAPRGTRISAPSLTTSAPVLAKPTPATPERSVMSHASTSTSSDPINQLGHLFAEFLERGMQIYKGGAPSTASAALAPTSTTPAPATTTARDIPVFVTGAGLGIPGAEHVFDDENVEKILRGDQLIDAIPMRTRNAMVDKRITRLVKSEDGNARFETIDSPAEVIKLAGRAGAVDLVEEYGFPKDRLAALDTTTRLAIAAGLDAMRDAGIPLVQHYKTTTKGTKLPDRWMLPEALRDDTGVIFASAFPGYDAYADEMKRYYEDMARRQRLEDLRGLRDRLGQGGDPMAIQELDRRIHELEHQLEAHGYQFDRRFLFKILAMGHSQFAEYIGARGPNTQVNAACASGTESVAVAQDWIRQGRCRRVIMISADNVTSDSLMEWIGAGFLSSGAAATDEIVEEAALPFDRRRHGMLIGMGAAALVIESGDAAAERGIRPICEVLSAAFGNSAFHGTRLDVDHIRGVMHRVVREAEQRSGISRGEMAQQMMFMSHETYTPARGGSAQAEIFALRDVFGDGASSIVISNTKGVTGHAMGAAMEDVIAVKALETGIVPPVANCREPDPELGQLNLSQGGTYPVQYALRLAAGFGSQIAMTVTRWLPPADGMHRAPDQLGPAYRTDSAVWQRWLDNISGYDRAQVEIQKRTLHVIDQGPPTRAPAARTTSVTVPSSQGASTRPAAATPASRPAPTPSPTPVPAPAPSAPVAGTPAQPAAGFNPVEQRVLDIVSSITGYPPDMLDPDLDLEADLGVDTVKQAETFQAVTAAYDIPRDDNLKLRDFPTMRHVMQYVFDKRPDLAGTSTAAPAALAPAPAPAPSASTEDPVRTRILAIVADITGYPSDMLDPELDLEADLGVDTVKQAETFQAVREAYAIPRDDTLQLRDFPTINHVVKFVYDNRSDLAAPTPAASSATVITPAPASAPATTPAAAPSASDPVRTKVLAIVAGITGYPEDMLDPELDLEADLGVDTVKQAETFQAVTATYDIPRDDSLQLRDFPTLNHVVQYVYDRRPDLEAPTTASAPAAPTAPPAAAAPTASGADDPVRAKILAIVAEITGYPEDMLDPELDLEADLGVDTVKQAETFQAVTATYDIPRDDSLQLRDFPTINHVMQYVYDRRPDLQAPAAATPSSSPPQALAPVAAPSTGAGSDDPVRAKVLAIVAGITGYPEDMLDPELDLEADLGVDTVKQAETFQAVTGTYDIPRDDTLQLRDFPTINHVVQYVYDRRPELVGGGAPPTTAAPRASEQTPAPTGAVVGDDAASDTIPRRVPHPVLRPALEACKTTGIELVEGKRVIVMHDDDGVAKALTKRLEKLGVEVLPIDDAPTADELETRLSAWAEAGPIDGLYWLPALTDEGLLTDLDLESYREALRVRVKLYYTTLRTLYDQVGRAGAFVVAATRLGGQHGYDEDGAVAPLGGPVVGVTKTFKREKPDTLVKCVDFPASRKTAALADILIEETLRDPGAVEIGHKGDARWTIGLSEIPYVPNPETSLEGRVFVITGAAGSIVSAIVGDLARASKGIFYLMDLTAEPDRNDPDLARFVSDKDGLKRDIFQRLKDAGKKATPVMVEKEIAGLERAQAALAAIQAVEIAGGTAHYRSGNLLDADAVATVVDEIREKHGRIDVLLHAGGLEISHMLPDKSPKEFDLVFDVKADGWFNLLKAAADMPIGATVVFSSIAGRFGNAGQADYSSANDLLCKTTSSFRTTRPDTRGIAIDWTAWGGIGMATRGSIPKMMEVAGIDMLPARAGIPMVRRELCGARPGEEIVVAQSLGVLMDEWDESGGLDPAALEEQPPRPVRGSVLGMQLYDGLTVETQLDPEQPFLDDHRIDDTPVLPGVMGIEAFAEAAEVFSEGLHVAALEDIRFLAPFKFYRDAPRAVRVNALFDHREDARVAHCRLVGSRTLANQAQPQITTHFTGRVRLESEPRPMPEKTPPGSPPNGTLGRDAIYDVYFHGPAYQVLESAWRDGERVVGLMQEPLPDNHTPADVQTVIAPRLIELCFQTAGVWEIGTTGQMGLPNSIELVEVHHSLDEVEGRLYAVVTRAESSTDAEPVFNARVVDDAGNVYVSLHGYRTSRLPTTLPDAQLAPLKEVMS